jgi:hypothetical protein
MILGTMAVHDLARGLMAQERGGSELPEHRILAGPRACQKLGAYLENLVGASGSQDLISRAIVLANEETHWLREVKVGADGTLVGFREHSLERDNEEAESGGEDILAELLGLLITFVGEAQTLRHLDNAWPEAGLTLASSTDGVQRAKEAPALQPHSARLPVLSTPVHIETQPG